MRRAFRLIILALSILALCTIVFFAVSAADTVPTADSVLAADTVPAAGATPKVLMVHYLDVGQADSILVQSPSGKTMLIDAGNSGDSEFIKDYIKKLKIKKIDILIATHPHEDHIGGMKAIVEAFDIGKIYMPKSTATTKTYKNLLTAVKNKNMKITTAVPGKMEFDADLNANILAPNSEEYKDLNDYSVVVKVTYPKTSFLFTGDAEEVSEEEMKEKKYDMKADVLKVGHHGSRSSTSEAFLKAVSPKYAIVSVGKDNDYGLPDETVMDRLEAAKVKVFRTDIDGTIIAKSDGKTVTFDKKPSSGDKSPSGSNQASSDDKSPSGSNQASSDDKSPNGKNQAASGEKKSSTDNQSTSSLTSILGSDTDISVYYSESGKSYHYSKSCSALSRSKRILNAKLSDVIKLGKSDPCDVCVK